MEEEETKRLKRLSFRYVNALWRLDHVVKRGMKEIQRAVEVAIFEVTFPNQHSESFRGRPGMCVEAVRDEGSHQSNVELLPL